MGWHKAGDDKNQDEIDFFSINKRKIERNFLFFCFTYERKIGKMNFCDEFLIRKFSQTIKAKEIEVRWKDCKFLIFDNFFP